VKYVIFHVDGGIGKNIMATAVVKAIKKAHQDRSLIVVSSHSRVFLNHPDVYRFYQAEGTQYFYEDFIAGKDSVILKSDPYYQTGYVNNTHHCIKAWILQCGLEYNNEEPIINLTDQELQLAQKHYGKWGKPILAIHPMGGAGDGGSWVRDMPDNLTLDVVKEFNDEYKIISIKSDTQPSIDGVDFITAPDIREAFALIAVSSKRLFIDSFAQHAAKALKLTSTVVWPINKVRKLGYSFHDNIVSTFPKITTNPNNHYLHEDDISGELSSSPFPANAKIFDKKIIFASLGGAGKKVDNSISALPDVNVPTKMDTFAGNKCNISKEDGSTKEL